MATAITTATGRIVWGVPHIKQPVIDDKTKVQAIDKNGQPIWEYAFGLAIPKAEFGPIWPIMQQEAAKVCNGVAPEYNPNLKDSFAYKFVDGDSMAPAVPAKGIPSKPYSDREGYAGCFVLAIKSRLDNPPPVFVWNGTAWAQANPLDIGGGNALKTGDYVQVGLSIDGHAGQSPGLYLNPQGVQFVGFGTLIMRGPDAAAMFGAGPAALPQGASATPLAPTGAPPMMPGNGLPGNGLPPPAPGAVPGPASFAPTPSSSPGLPTASPTSGLPGMPGQPAAPVAPAVAPVPGFAAGAPGMPGQPVAAAPAAPPTPPAPPAAPQRVQAGVDVQGRPYFYKADGSGTTEY